MEAAPAFLASTNIEGSAANRPSLGGRWPGGVGLGGHRRAPGALVRLLAPAAGHACERV